MTEAVIVAAARTPIGRSYKGSLVERRCIHPGRGGRVGRHRASWHRRQVPSMISFWPSPSRAEEPSPVTRAVRLGLDSVPGLADNRHCAAGLSAVAIAAGSIRAGMDRLMVAGGTESLSTSPRVFKRVPG